MNAVYRPVKAGKVNISICGKKAGNGSIKFSPRVIIHHYLKSVHLLLEKRLDSHFQPNF